MTETAKVDAGHERHSRFLGDLVAGVSVALVLIPQSLAYAEIAGVPAYVGLSAAALPPLIAAYFASSPYLQTGPVALTSLLTFGALAPLNEADPIEYVRLAALLAIIVGVVRVALGLFRFGSVAYMMTKPVVLGFTSGAAVLILASQLPKIFGLQSDAGVLEGAFDALTSPQDWQLDAIFVSAFTIVAMLGGRRIHVLFPGVLVAVLTVLIWSNVADYSGLVVGEIPGGFPVPSLDLPWDQTTRLLVPGFVIALVGFAEPASIARIYAEAEDIPWDSNRELVGQGIANVTSGVMGAFPIGGSFSRSSLGHLAGAKTRLSGAVTGAVVFLTLPLDPLLKNLPTAVLGAIVWAAAFKLIRVIDIYRMRTDSKIDASVAAFTFLATLASVPRIEIGVVLGIIAGLIARLYRKKVASSELGASS